jgi:hypothetical protein
MIHAYRLVYPLSQHTSPQIWEYEQPSIDHLLLNTQTFDRCIDQSDFEDWEALDRDNTHIWETYYRPKPLYDSWETWQEWLPEYRQLILEVQDIYEEHKARGTWRRPG